MVIQDVPAKILALLKEKGELSSDQIIEMLKNEDNVRTSLCCLGQQGLITAAPRYPKEMGLRTVYFLTEEGTQAVKS